MDSKAWAWAAVCAAVAGGATLGCSAHDAPAQRGEGGARDAAGDALADAEAADRGALVDANADAPTHADTSPSDAADAAVIVTPGEEVTWDGPRPPALSGGTLAVSRDLSTAIVSDPDTDRVVLVDFARRTPPAVLALSPGDEPGRIVEDGQRRAHVVLRGGGALLTIDLTGARPPARRAVCVSPRGVAWAEQGDVLHVACASGELVTLPAAGGDPTRRVHVAADLRDVVVHGNRLLVTRFRAAEVLTVDERGVVTQRGVAAAPRGTTPAVAWRAVPAPLGGMWLLRQHALVAPIAISGMAYYDSGNAMSLCTGTSAIIRPSLVYWRPPASPRVLPDLRLASLAVDVAVSPDEARLAVAVPGNQGASGRAQVHVVPLPQDDACLSSEQRTPTAPGQVVAVAWRGARELVVQTRAPAAVVILDRGTTYPLGGATVDHGAHRMYHTNPTGMVTCAACHPEGDDDGLTWRFNSGPPRRTHALRGGLIGTEPFHWDGDVPDFAALVSEVLVRRMGAPAPRPHETNALAGWIDALPARPAARRDPAAIARGEAVFRDPAVACASCHAGPRLSDGRAADVGSGGTFQVPSLLGLAPRAPYLHDGCAHTLRDVLRACGGEGHGNTAALSPAQLDDLVAFLESL